MKDKIQSLIDDLSAALIADGSLRLKTGQPVDDAAIAEIECKIGMTLPEDYRRFIKTYGWLGIGDAFFFGIWKDDPKDAGGGTILGETLRLREDYQLPHYLLPFFGSEYTSYVCLNTSPIENAHKVVYFDSENSLVHACNHASSFDEFLGGFLVDFLQSLKNQQR